MSKFAKLFDLDDGEQVLITMELCDHGYPSLRVVTEVDDVEASIRIEFGPTQEPKPYDIEKAWDSCSRAFYLIDRETALKLRQKMVDAYDIE